MDTEHPRFLAATYSARDRLKSIITFRKKADELYSDHPHLNKCRRAPLSLSEVPPWRRGIKENIIFPYLHGIKGRGDSRRKLNLLPKIDHASLMLSSIYIQTVQPRRAR